MDKNGIAKNISYTVSSNLLAFAISALVTFFVPKYIGVESYGLFQLYVFYSSYVGFLHFGWADGLYLRYGGEYYSELDKHKMGAQFWLITVFEVIVSASICVVGSQVAGSNKRIVIMMTAATVSIVISRTLLQYILQCTNRIKEYSRTVIIERGIYFIFVLVFLVIGQTEFYMFILSDIIGKTIALIAAIIYCKEVVFSRPERLSSSISEAMNNISVGMKLMLSNIASMLIIGIVRYSIERQWDVSTFGKVSLSLSVSNMLLVLVNAVALVMFPMLRRTKHEKYSQIYIVLRNVLMFILLGMLIVYYPVKSLLSMWLPQYSDSLKYLSILFPMCVFESKNSMLVATYMKALRKEKQLLIVNVITMILSIVATSITVYILSSLDAAVMSIIALIAVRSILGELSLRKELNINIVKEIALDVAITTVFIASSWRIGSAVGLIIYVIAYGTYLLIKKKDVTELLRLAQRTGLK